MHKSRKSIDEQQKVQMKTAKEIAKKYASSIGAKGYGSARFDLSIECEKEIIDYAKQKVKERDEQWIKAVSEGDKKLIKQFRILTFE